MPMLRSLLVPIDLAPLSDRVVGRAALLPLSEGCRVTLLHVMPRSMAPEDRRRAERDAKRMLAEEARALEDALPRKSVIERVITEGGPAVEIARCAQSVKADLIVMGRGSGQKVREVILGSTAERVLRRAKVPVLAVRLRPRGQYREPAVALDLDGAASDMIALLLRVIPPPRPSTLLIHAYSIHYAFMVYPSMSEDEFEERSDEHRQRAVGAIREFLATTLDRLKAPPGNIPAWKLHVRYGSPRGIIEKAVANADADLLVLGTRGHAGLAHAFLGTVAGDVLRNVTCDVLVVPPRSGKRRTAH